MEPINTPNIEKKQKIKYLDGLRGLAALAVVMDHAFDAFFASTNISPFEVRHSSFEDLFFKTPLHLILNGHFAVIIFFILSGFVLSYKFFNEHDYNSPISGAVKRYFRLAIPVSASIFIMFILWKTHLINLQPIYKETLSSWIGMQKDFAPHFIDMIRTAFYGVFIEGDGRYNTVLWTISLEFIGSMLVFAFLALFGKLSKRFIVYFVLAVIFFKTPFLAFIFGIILADRFEYLRSSGFSKWMNKGLFIPVTAIALLIGSVPFTPYFSYAYPSLKFLNIDSYTRIQTIHTFVAALLVVSIICSKPLISFLSHKIFTYLGRISFGVYLMHIPVLFTLTMFAFIHLRNHFHYVPAAVIACAITLPFVIPVAHLFTKFIDEPAIRFSSYVYKRFFENKNLTK